MNLKTIVTSKPSSPIISNSKHFLSPDTQTHVCTRTEQCLDVINVDHTDTKRLHLMMLWLGLISSMQKPVS